MSAVARALPPCDEPLPKEPVLDTPIVPEPQIPAVPRHAVARRQDYVLAVFIAASLIVHAAAILPSLINWETAPTEKAPHEIPVELVQAPPPETPKPPPAKAAEKPQPKKTAAKPEPKAEKPKPQVAKHEPPKPKEPPKDTPKPQQTAKAAPKPSPPVPSTAERMRQLLGMPPPGMEARALPGASDGGTETVSYAQLVLSQVAKAKKEGRFRGMPGAASVGFLVGDKGEVLNVEIKRPSGDASLDNEAVAMVQRAAPFPPPPPGGRRDYVVTLVFRPT